MRTTKAQAAALAGMLAAATGGRPRITQADGCVRVEADIPDALNNAPRRAILTALATADRYGHARTAAHDTVWAELDERDGP